ncbi:glycosyltransferase family 4 protein [Candidatus Woesearchaeota archaeon]|nr:glycosyltransferase family 4 protein [Candidatus Woesearchaeota archaeon]MBW3014403.1 glycosyltransferase family 4 protein [Candidatus Woesearchaeota archaeon]
MKKLLIVSDRFFPKRNGLVRFLEEIVPKLQDTFDISILAPRLSRKTKTFPGVQTILIPTYRFMLADYSPSKLNFRAVREAVKKSDIVWLQSLGTLGVMALHYAKSFQKKVCIYSHCKDWEVVEKAPQIPKWIHKIVVYLATKNMIRFYRNCDLLMLPSEELRKDLERMRIDTPKKIIPLGVDQKKFKPGKKKKKKSLTLGYSGRISNEKDLLTLYKAYNNLKSNYDLNFTIIGDGPDEQKKIFRQNGVKITGFVPDVENYLCDIDIFVSPSLTETTGLSTLEAMSCGLPVLSTSVGAMRKLIRPDYNGIFFRKKDVKELTARLKRLITDNKLREKIGKNARKSISGFSWDKTAEEIKESLASL